MSLLIRRATEADLPRLVELYQQLSLDDAREDPGPPLPEVYLEVFRRIEADPNYHVLLGEAAGRIVGSATVIVVPNLTYRGRPWAEIENVVVDDAERGSGYGKALIREAIEVARRAGCYRISLTSNNRREDAHRFYESLGFRRSHQGFRINL